MTPTSLQSKCLVRYLPCTYVLMQRTSWLVRALITWSSYRQDMLAFTQLRILPGILVKAVKRRLTLIIRQE